MKFVKGLNQKIGVIPVLAFLACFIIQIINAGINETSSHDYRTSEPKISEENNQSIIKPLSLAESLTSNSNSTDSSLHTTPLSWVSHTPIPVEWLKPDSKFNKFGILKIHDSGNQFNQIKPQEGLIMFRRKVKSLPIEQRIEFIEMGLNSDNPAIFDFSLRSIVSNRHHSSVNLLSELLQQKTSGDPIYSKIYKAHRQLIFYSLGNSDKAGYLQRIFLEDNPNTNQDLILWAIEEFGDIASIDYFNALIPLQKFPVFKEIISLTKIKLQLNSEFKENLDRYIQATLNSEKLIRDWGLSNIIEIKNVKAARFLLLLYEQSNIDNGLLEFEKIRETLETHKSKFPELYANLLPKIKESQNF